MTLISTVDIENASSKELRDAIRSMREQLRATSARRVAEATRSWVAERGYADMDQIYVAGHPSKSGGADWWATPYDGTGESMDFTDEANTSFVEMLDRAVDELADFDDGHILSVDFFINVAPRPLSTDSATH